MRKIAPAAVRYIKLGAKGSWTALCVERGELRLGFRDVPHDLCAAGDWEAVRQVFLAEGHDHVFFVCHTPVGTFAEPARTTVEDPKVHVWTGDRLAAAALNAGLFDWLVERSA